MHDEITQVDLFIVTSETGEIMYAGPRASIEKQQKYFSGEEVVERWHRASKELVASDTLLDWHLDDQGRAVPNV